MDSKLYKRWYFKLFLNTKFGRKLFYDNVFLADNLSTNEVRSLNINILVVSLVLVATLSSWSDSVAKSIFVIFIVMVSIWLIAMCTIQVYIVKLCQQLRLIRFDNFYSCEISSVIDYDKLKTSDDKIINIYDFLSNSYKVENIDDLKNSDIKLKFIGYPLPNKLRSNISTDGYDMLVKVSDFTSFFDELQPKIKIYEVD